MSYKVYLSTLLLLIVSTTTILSQGKLLSDKKLKKKEVFTNLEEALKSPEKVYRLDLDGSKPEASVIKSFPEKIYKFTNLQELNLSNNKIDEFPVDLSKLKNLQILDLSFNPIPEIPAEINKFKNLKSLKIKFAKLKSIPAELFTISTLQSVDLFANHIFNFPDGIKVNENIIYLNINRNGMSLQVQDKIKLLFPKADYGKMI